MTRMTDGERKDSADSEVPTEEDVQMENNDELLPLCLNLMREMMIARTWV